MDTDSPSDPNMKTRTHSQAPARKRTRKGSWEGLKPIRLASIHVEQRGLTFVNTVNRFIIYSNRNKYTVLRYSIRI